MQVQPGRGSLTSAAQGGLRLRFGQKNWKGSEERVRASWAEARRQQPLTRAGALLSFGGLSVRQPWWGGCLSISLEGGLSVRQPGGLSIHQPGGLSVRQPGGLSVRRSAEAQWGAGCTPSLSPWSAEQMAAKSPACARPGPGRKPCPGGSPALAASAQLGWEGGSQRGARRGRRVDGLQNVLPPS